MTSKVLITSFENSINLIGAVRGAFIRVSDRGILHQTVLVTHKVLKVAGVNLM